MTAPKDKLDVKDIERGAMLMRAVAKWAEMEEALAKTQKDRAMEIMVGDFDDDDDLVQPDGGVVVDIETGRLIAAAAREIVAAELLKMGVSV